MRATLERLAGALGGWRSESGPLYVQLADGIASLARSGALEFGAELPSERELAARLHLSRNTVKAAYQRLRDQGWIETHQGAHARLQSTTRRLPAVRPRTWAPTFIEDPLAPLDLATGSPEPAPIVQAALRDPLSLVPGLRAEGAGYSPYGEPALLAAIVERLRAEGMAAERGEVVVTNGGQHALSLVLGALGRSSAGIAVEEVTYAGTFDAIERMRAPMMALPMRGDGLDGLDGAAAARVIAAAAPAVIVLSTFHNPTGAVTAPDDARALLAAARSVDAVVVENRCPADLSISAPTPRPLATYPEAGTVLTIGAMTKVYWGGFRVGWIHANSTLAEYLRQRRMAIDCGSAPPLQHLSAALLAHHHEETVAWRVARIRESMDAVLDEVRVQGLPWAVRLPAGGPWLWIPVNDDADRLAARARRVGVRVVAGSYFAARDGAGDGMLRLSCQRPPEEMREGVRRLAQVV